LGVYHTAKRREVPAKDLNTHLDSLSHHRDLAEIILGALPLGTEVVSSYAVGNLLGVLRGPHDPLLATLVVMVNPVSLLSYIFAGWTVASTHPVAPKVHEISALASRLAGLDVSLIQNQLSGLLTYRAGHLTEEYYHALADYVPGAAITLAQDRRFAGYVFDKLMATDAPLEIIMDQLSVAPATPLVRMCEVITALCRVTSTTEYK
jgi:hypothetical protein